MSYWCYLMQLKTKNSCSKKFQTTLFPSFKLIHYRAGPLMIAIILSWGLSMIVMLVRKRTKYDFNLNSESDRIWLQSFSKRFKYDCNVEIRPRFTRPWFLDESRENKFSIIAIINFIWSFSKKIAITYGPIGNWHCNHI